MPGAGSASNIRAPFRIEISTGGLGADGLGVAAASASVDDLATAADILAAANVAAAATEATAAAAAAIGAFFRYN